MRRLAVFAGHTPALEASPVIDITERCARRLPLWHLVPLLLCVLLPLPEGAQASSPPPPLPAPSSPLAALSESEQEDPYGGYDDEPQDDEPRGEIIPREGNSWGEQGREGMRMFVESLSGLVLGLVGLTPGAYLGFALAASESSSDTDSAVLGVIGLGFVGVTVGSTLGVFGGGSLMGGEGRFLATLAGAALGGLLGGFIAVPAASVVEGGWVVPILTFPVIGAIIAYEQSHEREHERKAVAAGSRMEVVPVLGVRPSGGLVAGLAGRF